MVESERFDGLVQREGWGGGSSICWGVEGSRFKPRCGQNMKAVPVVG